jgi:hypothetical protein
MLGMAKSPTVSSTAAPDVDLVVVDVPAPTDPVVEAWFVETFHGLPDLSVENFNRFRFAADRLKARLSGKE